MNTIKAVIVDDEKNCQEVLKTKLKIFCPEVIVMDCCKSVASGLRSIKQYQPDLIFLDIAMPGEDGFTLLEKLDCISFEIIFTTAYDSYAVRAFECNALHFLLKPISHEDLVKAIDRFKKRIANTSSKQLISLLSDLDVQITDDGNSFIERKLPKQNGYYHDGLAKTDQLFMDKVLYLINENYGSTSFGVDQLAVYLGMSRMQLYRKVRELSDYTPGELLLKFRLDIAKELLVNAVELKISEISQKIGYGNKSNFTRAFKDYTGITPSEYIVAKKNLVLK